MLLVFSLTQSVQAANLSREQRISEGLEATVSAGSPVWLEAGPVRFLALYLESAEPMRYGGVILLHDSDAHADWHEVINPLRIHLAKRGWDTLSIQVPLAEDSSDPAVSDSLIASSVPRIQAGMAFLKSRKVDATVLIGHGTGANMAMNFVTPPGKGTKALVAIGLAHDADDDKDPVVRAIQGTELPILDLYGSRDLAAVIKSAPQRRALAVRNGRELYRLDLLPGADHLFSGMQEELSSRIAAWLRQTALRWKATRPPSNP